VIQSLVLFGVALCWSCCSAQNYGFGSQERRAIPLASHFFVGGSVQAASPHFAYTGDPYGVARGERAEAGYCTKGSRLYLSVDHFRTIGVEGSLDQSLDSAYKAGEMRVWYLLCNWDILFLKPHNFASPYLTLTAGLKDLRDKGYGSAVTYGELGSELHAADWERDEGMFTFGTGLGVDLKVSSAVWIALNGRVIFEGRKDDGKLQHPDVLFGIGARIRI
jgi:hypothetical protein